MSTLVVRAPAKPSLPLRGFAHAVTVLKTVLEIFAEAQQQAILAKKRYPFIEG